MYNMSRISGYLMSFVILVTFSVSNMVFAQDGTWTTKVPMPSANAAPEGAVVDDVLYVVKTIAWPFPNPPDQALYAYSPANDQWMTKSPMPTPRQSFGICVTGGKIYTIGGWAGWWTEATVEAYNPATDTWITGLKPMPKPRPYLEAGAVDGIIYTIGGYIPWVGITDTVEAYDTQTDTWTTDLTPMPTGRHFYGLGVVDGIIYTIGGSDGSVSSKVEAYDPSTDTWTTKASMPTARYQLAVEVIDGIIYAIGGKVSTDDSHIVVLDTVEAYNPKTDTWTTMAPMPTKRAHSASGAIDKTIYISGGYDDSGPLANLEAFATPPPIDNTPPVISITGISNGMTYVLGDVPTAGYTVTDDLSGVASQNATLTGGNTNGVGVYTYSVTATDNAGNQRTVTASYSVVYKFGGFLQPVNLDKPFKLGSTIPVKFLLTDANVTVVSAATATISLQKYSGVLPEGDPIDASSTSVADMGNTFRFSDSYYIYNLFTKGLTTGTWQIQVTLDDGTSQTKFVSLK